MHLLLFLTVGSFHWVFAIQNVSETYAHDLMQAADDYNSDVRWRERGHVGDAFVCISDDVEWATKQGLGRNLSLVDAFVVLNGHGPWSVSYAEELRRCLRTALAEQNDEAGYVYKQVLSKLERPSPKLAANDNG